MNIEQLSRTVNRRMLEKYGETLAHYKLLWLISTLFDTIKEVSLDEPIIIKGFGRFTKKHYEEKDIKTIMTAHYPGGVLHREAHDRPYFAPHKSYAEKVRLNSVKEPDTTNEQQQ